MAGAAAAAVSALSANSPRPNVDADRATSFANCHDVPVHRSGSLSVPHQARRSDR
jgi:hypothetical protein